MRVVGEESIFGNREISGILNMKFCQPICLSSLIPFHHHCSSSLLFECKSVYLNRVRADDTCQELPGINSFRALSSISVKNSCDPAFKSF